MTRHLLTLLAGCLAAGLEHTGTPGVAPETFAALADDAIPVNRRIHPPLPRRKP